MGPPGTVRKGRTEARRGNWPDLTILPMLYKLSVEYLKDNIIVR